MSLTIQNLKQRNQLHINTLPFDLEALETDVIINADLNHEDGAMLNSYLNQRGAWAIIFKRLLLPEQNRALISFMLKSGVPNAH